MQLWRNKGHKRTIMIELIKIYSFFWNFLISLYLCQKMAKYISFIYHSIARNLLYKIPYEALAANPIYRKKKSKYKNPLSIFE
jgi:hypothetical protein